MQEKFGFDNKNNKVAQRRLYFLHARNTQAIALPMTTSEIVATFKDTYDAYIAPTLTSKVTR
ncbi:MAG TPA: hypothetical protein DD666_09905 [Advenella kashmirensis]|uniref:Uncharacterized protein n=1 Tax=Advenella kashmirensis TaxID=310575 RepID=A0A356LFF3_9BURK|nr:hypothetical protein [Advenella kashmirensis]